MFRCGRQTTFTQQFQGLTGEFCGFFVFAHLFGVVLTLWFVLSVVYGTTIR
jgi:hypothetical protein